MKRSRALVFLFALFASTASCLAQSPAASPTPAYVTVAFNSAVMQTDEAQRAFAELQSKFAPRQTHLQELNTQIESLKKQINDGGASLTDADKNAKLHTLDAEERQLQREADDFKADTESASQQAFQVVAQKLYSFLQAYAKQHAYILVVDRGSDATPVVWYASPDADITIPLIKAYDQKVASTPSSSRIPSNPRIPSAPTPH